jgi:hypothetical protein
MIRTYTIILAMLLIALNGCADGAGVSEESMTSSQWTEFGLPSKGDDPGCDRASILCWTTVDADVFRAIMGAEDQLILDPGSVEVAVARIVDGLSRLTHKLDAEQGLALTRITTEATTLHADMDETLIFDWLSRVRNVVSVSLREGYFVAHSVSLGALSEAGSKFDQVLRDEPAGSATGLTAGMLESLRVLKENGALGQAYAFLLQHTGVLEQDYDVLDEEFPFSEPMEDRAEKLVERARWASARLNLVTNLESLIPFVGIAISVPHDVISNFRIRARLVFELGALYGLDIRQGNNLLVATQLLLSAIELPETRIMVASAMALPLVVATAMHVTKATLPRRVLRTLTLRALSNALAHLSYRGKDILARAVLRASARGVGRQVLGYATLGVSIIANVALATAATSRIGTHAHVLSRPWGSSSLQVGSSILNQTDAALCTARFLGQLARFDGGASPEQIAFLAGHFRRPTYIDGVWFPPVRDARTQAMEQLRHDGDDGCAEAHLATLPVSSRRTLVGWFATLVAIDGNITLEERSALDEVLLRLDGSDTFGDGIRLREDDTQAIVAHIETLFSDHDLSALGLDTGSIASFERTRLVWGLDTVSEPDIRDVSCALHGICPH